MFKEPLIKLSKAARPAVFEVETVNELGERGVTSVAGEHPLTIYLDKRELVTLMTLGTEPEYLSLGYLRNQGFVTSCDELAQIQVDWDTDSVAITSSVFAKSGLTLWNSPENKIAKKMERRTVTTGCGQGTVFGGLMDDVARIAFTSDGSLHQSTLMQILEQMRKHESIYKVAGAVHGCALFEFDGQTLEAKLLCFVEDVGRHNAVDAIAGWMWLNEPPQAKVQVFYTTGRLTSEMVIKAAQMGIAILVSRSGLTHMGYQLAKQLGMTLIGRCQGRHFLVFSGQERFIGDPGLAQYPAKVSTNSAPLASS